MNLLKRLFSEPFSPDLIDLVKYEQELLWQQKHGCEHFNLQPPSSTPDRMDRNWTDSETQAMRDNRERAEAIYREIYDEIKNGV